MVTDGFRLCSPGPEVELVGVTPLTVADTPTVGTAGGTVTLPFTGEAVSGLPCWEPPAAADGVELLDADGRADAFLVALA